MQNIDMLLKSTNLNIKKQHISYATFPEIEYIYICSNSPLPIREHSAYIGTSEQIGRLLSMVSKSFPILFIANDCPDDFWSEVQDYSCNFLFIPQELLDICNSLNDLLNTYRHWQHSFELMILKKSNLQSMIEAGAQMLESPVFLLNSGYSLIAHHNGEQAHFPGIKELLQKGFLSIDNFITLKENSKTTLLPIRHGFSILGYLVISLSQDEYRINYLSSLLLMAVKSHLSLPDPTSPLFYRLEFEQLVYDLIDMNINTIDEIHQRFQILNLTLKTHFFCIVVKPTDTVGITRPLNPMINGLQKIFTDGHYSIYQRSIIGLIPTSHREIPSFNQEALIELLGHWSADIGFSSVATHLEHFRTFYLMSVQAIRFGCTFGHESGAELPIYHFEDYRIYHMIDMCKDGFTQLYCHDNLIYMCHPFIIRLYQYDQKNSSDLLHVLYTYFKFSCNLAQTARQLNFHRNTMMNKISKIESVLKTSLDDNQLRQSLTFSYLILRYISEYLKKDIFAFNVTFKAQSDD